jgi:hypothetical protein
LQLSVSTFFIAFIFEEGAMTSTSIEQKPSAEEKPANSTGTRQEPSGGKKDRIIVAIWKTIEVLIKFIWNYNAARVLGFLLFLGLVVLSWSRELVLAFVTVSAAFTGALLCISFFYKNISDKLRDKGLKLVISSDLHSHVVNLHVNFQTVTTVAVIFSTLLGFFGIQSYQNLKDAAVEAAINTVTDSLQSEIRKQQNLVKELTSQSNKINEQAQNSIKKLRKIIEDIADTMLSKKLSNVVVAYAGRDSLPQGWSLYKDSVNKFILGSSEQQQTSPIEFSAYKYQHQITQELWGKIILNPVDPGTKIEPHKHVVGRPQEFYIKFDDPGNAIVVERIKEWTLYGYPLRYVIYDSARFKNKSR